MPGEHMPGVRDLGPNVTVYQKRNLARLAKLGLGPAAQQARLDHAHGNDRDVLQQAVRHQERPFKGGPDLEVATPLAIGGMMIPRRGRDNARALLEAEKRAREEEEVFFAEQKKAQEAKAAKLQASKAAAALKAQELRKIESHIAPKDLPTPADHARRLSVAEAFKQDSESESEIVGEDLEDIDGDRRERPLTKEQLKRLKAETELRRNEEQERQRLAAQKKKSRKRKRGQGGQDDSDDGLAEEGDGPEPDPKALLRQTAAAERKAAVREGEAIFRDFKVKGEVSRDYKGMTDADLERRFGAMDSGGASASNLMSENQVLSMMRRQRRDNTAKPGQLSSHRRAQREAAEWETVKQKRVQQTGFGKHKDRAVVSR